MFNRTKLHIKSSKSKCILLLLLLLIIMVECFKEMVISMFQVITDVPSLP